jgi:TIR domain
MIDKVVTIFLSYAVKDNRPPPGDTTGKRGFVTTLADSVEFELDATNDAANVELWCDFNYIDNAQQFTPAIVDAISRSSYFVIVLSNHWLESSYCRKELEMFRACFPHETDFQFGHRLILAHKTWVPNEKRPAILPEQRGLRFFVIARDGIEIPFFHRGEANCEFHKTVSELTLILKRRAKYHPEAANSPEALPTLEQPTQARNGLKVYLAKPAADMRTEYDRLHRELTGHGCRVAPDRNAEIPIDASAIGFIDEAMKDAAFSIHPIGQKPGYTPEDLEPIVKLQLHRAELIVGKMPETTFRRFAWVPKFLEDANGETHDRDPIETFKTFAKQLAGDRIDGSSVSIFAEWIMQHIDSTSNGQDSAALNGEVYLYHHEGDTEYAIEIADLLAQNKITYAMPAFLNAPDAERDKHHKEQLVRCGAVVMCWATASETWARQSSKELENWRKLGRSAQFSSRTLIAGPPPHLRKEDRMLRHIFSNREFDKIANWTGLAHPRNEDLRDVIANIQK